MKILILKKIFDSHYIFAIIIAIFILSLGFVICSRGGKDLKVDLFGVEQVLQKKSPYENPTDPNRPLFRYAPAFTILLYPFLLKSRMIAPFVFENIIPSALAWYLIVILSLFLSIKILLRLIPSPSQQIGMRNLKISLLLALPLIGYELSNSQNKLIALFFMLVAIFLFEKNRPFLSALCFNLALTIYIALLPIALYFIIRNRRFIFSFIVSVLIIFLIFPSLIFGIQFNIFLLREWFLRCLKPFFLTHSYATYIDLRPSSQSLPSAIGRIFVSGHTRTFQYLISPSMIHIIIRALSVTTVLFSCLAVWKSSRFILKGFNYAIFLMLALILPQYCIYYTWSWLFMFYFIILNYISFPEVSIGQKKILLTTTYALVILSCLVSIRIVDHFSFLFWATIALWLEMVVILLRQYKPQRRSKAVTQ